MELGRSMMSAGAGAARKDAGIDASDAALLANPYLLFECDRRSLNPVAFGDPADPRRVRALVVDLLEEGAAQGHTVLPRSWVIRRARERALQPPCPLGENVLDATGSVFAPVIEQVATGTGEAAYQIDRLMECREIIRREVRGRQKGKPHIAPHDWRAR